MQWMQQKNQFIEALKVSAFEKILYKWCSFPLPLQGQLHKLHITAEVAGRTAQVQKWRPKWAMAETKVISFCLNWHHFVWTSITWVLFSWYIFFMQEVCYVYVTEYYVVIILVVHVGALLSSMW